MFHKMTPRMRGVSGLYRGSSGYVQICRPLARPGAAGASDKDVLTIVGESWLSPDVSSGASPIVRIVGRGQTYMSINNKQDAIEFLAGINGSTGVFLGSLTNHPFDIRTNNTARLSISAAGLSTFTGTGEVRIALDAGFFSGYNTANNTRTGYLQFNPATGLILNSELAGNALALRTNAITAFNITSAQLLQGLGPVAAGLVNMTPDASTFTATPTGGTTPVTGTAVWYRIGNAVLLILPVCNITSNVGTFTITGLPAAIQVARAQRVPVSNSACVNNSVTGVANVSAQFAAASGTITFDVAANASGWATTGSKGLSNATVLAYSIG